MTVQEAKEILEALFSESTGEDYPYTDKFGNALRMAIESMEKQIPKKPNVCKNLMTKGSVRVCPSCSTIIENTDSYCYECGQKLDWEEGGTSD